MILALVGSRHFTDYKLFKRTVLNFLCKHNDSQFPSEIVSGGARGADRLAVQFAAEFDVPLKEYEPELSATSRSGKMEFARAARELATSSSCSAPRTWWHFPILKAEALA